MEVEKKPYELLVRWDRKGGLAGAHVCWRYVISEAGAFVREAVSGAEPVDIGQGTGFPLDDILPAVVAEALVDRDRERARVEDLERKNEDLQTRLSEAERAVQQVNSLREQIGI